MRSMQEEKAAKIDSGLELPERAGNGRFCRFRHVSRFARASARDPRQHRGDTAWVPRHVPVQWSCTFRRWRTRRWGRTAR